MPLTFFPCLSRLAGAFLAASGLALGALLLPGCGGDNVTCVFTSGCQGDDGTEGIAGNPAIFPANGQTIDDRLPFVVRVAPEGDAVTPGSPVVVVFSESMNPDTLLGALRLVDLSAFPPMAIGLDQVLVSDGQVLLMLPGNELVSGIYAIEVVSEDPITDLTGQPVDVEFEEEIARFTVDDTLMDPTRVLTTFPDEGDTGVSDTIELVVVFDGPIDAGTVTADSIDVTVGMLPPNPDPDPIPVNDPLVDGPRVFTYRSAAADGSVASLGAGADVDVAIGPMAAPILDAFGGAVIEDMLSFATTNVLSTTGMRILSMPADAIGIDPLTTSVPMDELELEIDLADGQPGDRLDLFLFGTNIGEDPQLIALVRGKDLSGMAPIMQASFTRDELDLLASSSPVEARFADGVVAMALRVTRGGDNSTLALLDVDTVAEGIQDAIIDVTAPTILELFHPRGETIRFRSDQRGLVIGGVASEFVRAVEVVGDSGDNGTWTPAAGSDAEGTFLAEPAPFDPDIPTGSYDVTVYDLALNPSTLLSGTVEHLGIVGTTAFNPGDALQVEVFDAFTLDPIELADVFVHRDDLGVITLDMIATTDAMGMASFLAAAAGADDALVTVEAAGYDLFTFQGVPATRMSIGLAPSNLLPTASVQGEITTQDSIVSATLPALTNVLADTRRLAVNAPYYEAGVCIGNPSVCPHGPRSVHAELFGAQSLVSGVFMQSELLFDRADLIQAFELIIPTPSLLNGGFDVADVQVAFLINAATSPPEESAIELPMIDLDGTATAVLDFASLSGDPLTSGDPRVTVETLVGGLGQPVPVGLGLSYELGMAIDRWTVRSAQPGAVSPLGAFASAVDSDLFVRLDVVDTLGNRSQRRPRLSALMGAEPISVPLEDVPDLIAPPDMGNTGGASFDVVFDDTVADGFPGLAFQRVELFDSTGRIWNLWTIDGTGPQVTLHVPPLPMGSTGLADGALSCTLHALSIPAAAGLSPVSFLWSDLEREADAVKRSRPFDLTQP